MRALGLTLLCACAAAPPIAPPVPDAAPCDAAAVVDALPAPSFVTHHVPTLGLTVDVLAGVPVLGSESGESTHLGQATEDYHFGVIIAPGMTLEHLRPSLPPVAEVVPPAEVVICGRPAQRLEYRVPETEARGSECCARPVSRARPSAGAALAEAHRACC